jgi:DNA-binding transcriptional regulator YiaG
MKRNPFAESLVVFRRQHNLSQTECSALIPHLSVRMIEKWERSASEPPLWSQCLILDALHDAMTSD